MRLLFSVSLALETGIWSFKTLQSSTTLMLLPFLDKCKHLELSAMWLESRRRKERARVPKCDSTALSLAKLDRTWKHTWKGLLLKGKLVFYWPKVFFGPKLRQVSKGNFHRKALKWVKNQVKGPKIHQIRNKHPCVIVGIHPISPMT